MAILRNNFEGQSDGTNVTTVNSAASGDALNNIVVANSPANGGNAAIQYEADAAVSGSMGVRITQQASATYIRWDVAEAGTRFVARRSLKITGAPSSNVALIQMRNTGGTIMGQFMLGTDLKPYLTHGTTSIVAAKPSAALPNGTYWIELAITKESGGGGNGVVEIGVFDLAEEEIHTYTYSTGTTGTADAGQYRFGQVSGAAVWATEDIDGIAAGPQVSGWLGPEVDQLDTPVVTITAQNGPSTIGGSDGDITITWDAVDGADSYDVAIAEGVVTGGFSASDTDVTSPYKFENLTAGTYTVAVKAVAP